MTDRSADCDEVLEREIGVLYAEVHANVSRQLERIKELPDPGDEREQFSLTWEMTILTLALDVSGSAVLLAREDQQRAARILNRSLMEYAYRLHHFALRPEEARRFGLQYANFVRHMLRPWGQERGNLVSEEWRSFRAFVSTGSEELGYPNVQRMMASLLANHGLRGGELRRWCRRLEAEYALGSALAHGSQGAIADVFTRSQDGSEPPQHHLTSPHFTVANSLMRTTIAMWLILRALECRHKREMGSGLHYRDIALRCGAYPREYSVFTFVPFVPPR